MSNLRPNFVQNLMKSVDINPSDEWMNMAMAGVPPQNKCLQRCSFLVRTKEVEMQATVSKIMQQYRGKCEEMQAKFTEKLEQVHTAYQKAVKKIHLMQQEVESLSKDKEELQEKYAEKSRQKRKLEEMYDALRNEYEQSKRSVIQPRNNFLQRTGQDDLFSSPANLLDVAPAQQGQDELDGSNITPVTPGHSNDFWNPPRQRGKTSPVNVFDIAAGGPSAKSGTGAGGNRQMNTSSFGASKHSLFTPVGNNPSNALRNLILSPMKRQAASRLRPKDSHHNSKEQTCFPSFMAKIPNVGDL